MAWPDLPLWFGYLLVIFAVYRLAQLLAVDEGPFGVFVRFRKWAANKAAGAPRYGFHWTVASLFACPWCVGVFLSLAGALPFSNGSLLRYLVFWLAIAGGQAFLESLSSRQEENS